MNDREEIANKNEKLFQLLEKICSERLLWGKPYHTQHFTGGVNFCLRNENIKLHLMQHFMRKDTPIDACAKTISKSDCLEPKESTCAEYQHVNLGKLEENPLILTYLPKNLTPYAFFGVRNLLGKAFKLNKITKSDKTTKTFVIQSNQSDCVNKVRVLNGYTFCTCLNYFHTGFPCEHALLVSFSQGYKFLIHQRWSLNYESLLQDM